MTTKLRITQKGRDVLRTAASIAAYTLIAVVVTAGMWGAGSIIIAGARAVTQ